MKTKHTPGPWNYTPSTKGGTFMAKVQCGDNTTFSVSSHCADGQADANAQLIAAAPEMLEALERIEVMLQSNRDAESDFLLTLIRPAIAKAKGE